MNSRKSRDSVREVVQFGRSLSTSLDGIKGSKKITIVSQYCKQLCKHRRNLDLARQYGVTSLILPHIGFIFHRIFLNQGAVQIVC